MNGIAHELSVTGPNYRIIRRRAVWLIGQWSGVKLSPELRPKLYQVRSINRVHWGPAIRTTVTDVDSLIDTF